MKIGIITPMAEEKLALVSALSNVSEDTAADIAITQGEYGQHQVVLLESGIGKVAAATATTVLIREYQPDVVINTGSAGALVDGLTIGDIVIGQELTYFDADVTVFGYEYGQLPAQPACFVADATLVKQFTDLTTAQRGLIVSGDTFVQQTQKEVIHQHFPTALLAEMEGAAVAQVATRFAVPFIVLRGVSDLANGESGIVFDDYVVAAGRASAQLLLSFMEQY